MSSITLINCIVVLLIHEVQLKVVLLGVTEDNSAKVTFNCSFSVGSHDCSAEFLYNTETLDTLRASNSKCYHKQKLCSNDTCSCSNDCKTFILSVSNKNYTNGDIIGCEVHYMDQGNVLSTTREIIFNGSEFFYYNTNMQIVAQPDRDSSLSQTEPPDVRKLKPDERVVIAVLSVGVVMLFGIPILLCVTLVRRKQNHGHHANITQVSRNDNGGAGRRENISQGSRDDIQLNIYRKFNNNRSGLAPKNTNTDSDRKFSRLKPGSTSKIIKRESHRILNRPRPCSLPAILTKESYRTFTKTRPASFSAISKESYRNLKKTRPASFSAISTKDSNRNLNISTPGFLWSTSTTDSKGNLNRSTPGSVRSISSTVSLAETTSISSGVALITEETHM